MSDTIAIAVRVSDELERQRIASMFEVMSPQLHNHWVVTVPHDAAVLVIDADDPGSDYFLAACKEAAGAVPILLGRENLLQAEWFLQKPVRVKALVTLLNHLGQYLRGRNSRQQQKFLNGDSNGQSDFFKLRRAFEYLLAQPAYYRLDISATLPVYYDSVHDRLLLPHELVDMANPFNALHHVVRCFQQRRLHAITVERFKSVSNDTRFALFKRETLIWAWCLGHAEVAPENPLSQHRYQLLHWPNLAALPHTATHLKLCQYMTTHQATQQDIASATQVPLQTVIGFCNACESLGLLQVKDAPALTATKTGNPP